MDEAERTPLVTGGPFAVVRNPIFAAMIPTSLGGALLVPTAAAVAGFAALVLALELQVRLVEEPHLLRARRPLRPIRLADKSLLPGRGEAACTV